MALGSGGANRIRTAIAQVLSNSLDFGMTPEAAVEAPRMHLEHGELNMEAGLSEIDNSASLSPFKLNAWDGKSIFFGGVHLVGRDDSNQLFGVGDSRRNGSVEATNLDGE